MKKNVLILGSGGREHAIALKINQSPLCSQVFIMPGNPGTMHFALQIPGDLSNHNQVIKTIYDFNIDIVICGPEVPLAEGLMDAINETTLSKPILVGPVKSGAMLESSKAYSKEFMKKYDIPTAAYNTFDTSSEDKAVEFILQMKTPIVIKASGLAAGKGVVICKDHEEALCELKEMLHGKFGSSSETIVIEEFLDGIEFSVFILTNGSQYAMLPVAKDYKRIGVNDMGPNTGGMGAVSPVLFLTDDLKQKVVDRIINKTLQGLSSENIPYKGFIFFGLIDVNGEPFVIEYNCRLGDPETEVILPRLNNDLLEMIIAMEENTLDQFQLEENPNTAVTIMLVSENYPGPYEKGKDISIPSEIPENVTVYHAGTIQDNGQLKTNGGRVLSITSLENGLQEALNTSLKIAEQIQFDGKYYRNDIGKDLLKNS